MVASIVTLCGQSSRQRLYALSPRARITILDKNNIAGHRSRVVATVDRLKYCLYNLIILGDHRNPEMMDIETTFRYLINLAKQSIEGTRAECLETHTFGVQVLVALRAWRCAPFIRTRRGKH